VTQLNTTPRADDTPLSVRAVDRVAALLAGRGSTRRRFLYRTAVVGSALALDPLRYVLRPTPAYASVCGSGDRCGDGWSVFCCTINEGANTCPDHAYVAGWWKVDASAFCLGSPRYYIDCNRRPDGECHCHCNDSSCDRRRVCCNVFRYGQCNTHIGGVTEVVCRIITCTPPWQWDPSCGRTVRVSESTRSHTSTCLPGRSPSRIEIKYQDMGLRGSILGDPVTRERDAARGGRKRRYERGMILHHRGIGTHEVHGEIATRYRQRDAELGELGYPTSDELLAKDGQGAFSRFEHGSVYRHPQTGTWVVLGRTDDRYRRLRGPNGVLGYPTSGTHDANGAGKVTQFQRGAIYSSADTDAVEVRGSILEVFTQLGGPRGSTLGFPTKPRNVFADGGRQQRFERGIIAGPSAGRVFAVRQQIEERFSRSGGADGPWGYPTSHTQPIPGTAGLESRFETRTAFWKSATGTRWLNGPILQRYRQEGGPNGSLGFPTSDVRTAATGVQRATFEHGAITYDPATDTTTVLPPAS
jgi:hypothetical protein